MPRFITGDELGNLKAYVSTTEDGSTEVQCSELLVENDKLKSVQMLAVAKSTVGNLLRACIEKHSCDLTEEKVASAFADGTVLVHSLGGGDNLKLNQCHEWQESSLKPGESFVGLSVSDRCG